MLWVDVMGPPGAGKSTVCDHFWGPNDLPLEDYYPPLAWQPFLTEIDRLFHLIRKHPTYSAAIRMNNRSIRKMATVWRDPRPGPYIQTGLAQRGLGFGWRLHQMGIDLRELRSYFHLMPVSIGVAVTKCPQNIIEERNHARTLVKQTAHEDRAHMVGHMMPAIEIALEVLHARGVPILEISTQDTIESSREVLREFAAQAPFEPEEARCSSKMEVLSPPAFWLGQRCRKDIPGYDCGTKRRQNNGWTYYRRVEEQS